MNKNFKFFSGLSLGLLLGFVLFNVNTSFSSTTETTANSNPSVDGFEISSAEADVLIASYQTNFVQKNGLPSNTTRGGVISKANLKEIAGRTSDDLIKFRFSHTTGADGADHIGLIFYKTADATTAVRTGNSSYCPVLCD